MLALVRAPDSPLPSKARVTRSSVSTVVRPIDSVENCLLFVVTSLISEALTTLADLLDIIR